MKTALDSLAALRNQKANVKILFDGSVRDYNLAMAQRFFDKGAQQEMLLEIGKAEEDRFQQMQLKIPFGCKRKSALPISQLALYVYCNS